MFVVTEHRPHTLPPVEPVGGWAALMLADAMWVEQVTASELAEAARRPVEWVEGVLSGEIDPTADELELVVNAIGLETRPADGIPGEEIMGKPWPWVPHDREKLAERIKRSRQADLELYGEVLLQRKPPQPDAPARLFGVGQGREDGGGKAAMIISAWLRRLRVSPDTFAERAGLPAERVEAAASGEWKPGIDELERMLAANGVSMAYRLEEYDSQDDEHHAMWESDPAAYDAATRALEKEIEHYADWPR